MLLIRLEFWSGRIHQTPGPDSSFPQQSLASRSGTSEPAGDGWCLLQVPTDSRDQQHRQSLVVSRRAGWNHCQLENSNVLADRILTSKIFLCEAGIDDRDPHG